MLKDKQKRWINEFNCGIIVQLCNHNIQHLIYDNVAKQANKILKRPTEILFFFYMIYFP